MSNESKKPEVSNSQPEPAAANRRAFMKTVMTGTVAAGLAASVGKAEAATPNALCGDTALPASGPTSVRILVNKNNPASLDRIWQLIHDTFQPSGCPNCGLGGVPHDPNGPFPISDVHIEVAYLSKDVDSAVIIQDAPAVPPSR
ncbi:MAG: hypothetical protein ACJ8AT_02045 [Hyalangium sp.]|uniref:hypothetical protein n=1 Tax=Hyalangium sp. TaxID=2028555 RepID=UPI00389B2216